MNGSIEVVVVRGGYARALAADRLTRRDDVTATLDPRPHFVDRIRLHRLVGGTHDAVAPTFAVLAAMSLGLGVGAVLGVRAALRAERVPGTGD